MNPIADVLDRAASLNVVVLGGAKLWHDVGQDLTPEIIGGSGRQGGTN